MFFAQRIVESEKISIAALDGHRTRVGGVGRVLANVQIVHNVFFDRRIFRAVGRWHYACIRNFEANNYRTIRWQWTPCDGRSSAPNVCKRNGIGICFECVCV